MNTDFNKRFIGAGFVTAVVFALYGAVVLGFAPKPEADLAEVLKALVTLAAGYWIGSSSGSATKDPKEPPKTPDILEKKL